MQLVGRLVGFGLRVALGEAADSVLDLANERFKDHSQALPRALARANERSWQALALALDGDGLLDHARNFFASADAKGLRAQLRPFLDRNACAADQTSAKFRKACLTELHAARQQGLLVPRELSVADVGRQAADAPFAADPHGLLDAATQAVGRLADDLAPQCPSLAQFLRRPTPSGPPLLAAAFAYFLRREIETDAELARGLFFDGLRQLAADQADAFTALEQTLSVFGQRFDEVLAQGSRVEQTVTQTHGAVLDLHAELQRLSDEHRSGMDEVRRLIQETLLRLGPQHPLSARNEDEKEAVSRLVVRMQRLPAEERQQAPALLNGLARLQAGTGDFAGASATFAEASRAARRAGPRRRAGTIITNAVGMAFAWVPAGTFLMGSPPQERDRRDDETPHAVSLTGGFYLGVYPVTQSQWRSVMGANPSRFPGDDRPVECVSWQDCQDFCARLADKDGRSYRLPSEAEWEYACRAGTAAAFYCGDCLTPQFAHFDADQTSPVGRYADNAWGLCDLHGNVFEWCADWYGPYPGGRTEDPAGPAAGDVRALRGGSWLSPASYCRSAYRYWTDPGARSGHIGLRVCQAADE
jgi:formylglycine-generating enzyme required for sulfatase activity